MEDNEKNRRDTLFEMSCDALRDHKTSFQQITVKATFMIGVAIIMAGQASQSHANALLTVIMCTLLFACIACGLYVIFPKTYWEGPDLEKTSDIFSNYSFEDSKEWVTKANIMAVERYSKKLNRSGQFLWWGIFFLTLAVALYFVPLITGFF